MSVNNNDPDQTAPTEEPWILVPEVSPCDSTIIGWAMINPRSAMFEDARTLFPEDHSAKNVSAAGGYLLKLLAAEGQVKLSRFFSGDETIRRAMRRAWDLDDRVQPELLITFAISQLKAVGIVDCGVLQEMDEDGNLDYLIELILDGWKLIESGEDFPFEAG